MNVILAGVLIVIAGGVAGYLVGFIVANVILRRSSYWQHVVVNKVAALVFSLTVIMPPVYYLNILESGMMGARGNEVLAVNDGKYGWPWVYMTSQLPDGFEEVSIIKWASVQLSVHPITPT